MIKKEKLQTKNKKGNTLRYTSKNQKNEKEKEDSFFV